MKENRKEGRVSLDDAKGTSVDPPVTAVLSGLDSIFILQQEQRTAPNVFLVKSIFTLLQTDFGKCLAVQSGT